MDNVFITADFMGSAALLAPDGAGKRRTREFVAIANKAGVLHWKENLLKNRFLPGNAQKYRHQARKEPYEDIKQKLARGEAVYIRGNRIKERVQRGGSVNIVRSGRTENSARRVAPVAAYATRASTSVEVNGAIARRPGPGKPDMKAEILFTPDNEKEDIRQVMWRKFRFLFVGFSGRKRIKV